MPGTKLSEERELIEPQEEEAIEVSSCGKIVEIHVPRREVLYCICSITVCTVPPTTTWKLMLDLKPTADPFFCLFKGEENICK